MSGAAETEILLRRFFDHVLNERDRAAAGELLAESFTDHDPAPGQAPGIEGFLAALDAMRAAFPDARYEPMLVIPEESRVAAHWRLTATNEGALFGQAPTGKPVSVTGVEVLGIRDGRVDERWSKWERHIMFGQLGITPAGPGGG